MYAFTFERPSAQADAVKLAKAGGKPLAGGQTLLASMKLRLASPEQLVDLGAVKELAGIRKDGNSLVIGAMTRHADVAESQDVQAAIPALAALAGGIGDKQVRAMGTIGGSLANNDPAADYPAAALPPRWRWVPPSSPPSAKSLPTTTSRACLPPRWKKVS